jgi:hypothetical protein
MAVANEPEKVKLTAGYHIKYHTPYQTLIKILPASVLLNGIGRFISFIPSR